MKFTRGNLFEAYTANISVLGDMGARSKMSEETEALSPEEVTDLAQMVADEFTKEDAEGDKFSAYMTYKVGKIDGMHFELDTEATEQTPPEEAKYGTGEGWGGNFRIDVKPNGYEIRNSEKGGLVATLDDTGFNMLDADQSRAEMGLDENALGFNDSRLSSDQHRDLDYAVRGDSSYTFGNDPYADDQLRYKYAQKMGFLENKIKKEQDTMNESINKTLRELENSGNMAALEAKMMKIDELIDERRSKMSMAEESTQLMDMINPKALKEVEKEIAILEKKKEKYSMKLEKMKARGVKKPIEEGKKGCDCGCGGCGNSLNLMNLLVK